MDLFLYCMKVDKRISVQECKIQNCRKRKKRCISYKIIERKNNDN
jgi:hypothetical protein